MTRPDDAPPAAAGGAPSTTLEPPDPADAVALARALIRRPSVTPEDAGALDVLEAALRRLGFRVQRLPFAEDGTARVDNLYARLGEGAPNFCFAGHTDVVPAGDRAAWSVDPFAADLRDGVLTGRGAADMKGAIAAFVAAVARMTARWRASGGGSGAAAAPPRGSVSLLITGDEEGPAVNGTRKMLARLAEIGETLDHCLVGEPTNPDAMGDMIKIGRRGSLTGWITVRGTQGHVAYPHLADNPAPKLARLVDRLTSRELDAGTEHFQPSSLQFTTIDIGNPATNVIPGEARATFNCRFNDRWTGDSLAAEVRRTLDAAAAECGADYTLKLSLGGPCFLTPPGPFTDLVAAAVAAATGRAPALSTSGGTSDARFIKDVCPVVEFGLVGRSMHKVDEHAAVADIETLRDIYADILARYFANPPIDAGRGQ